MNRARFLRLDGDWGAAIKDASRAVSNGGLIAYPTDTVYGLGCDPFNPTAVRSVVAVKRRQKGALPVLVDGLESARRLGAFCRISEELAQAFWPGQVTLIVPAVVPLPAEVAPSGMIGLRVPKRDDTLALIRQCKGSIVGTSANISGEPSCTSAGAVMAQLGEKIDLILDGGPLAVGVESTVLLVSGGYVLIVREAAVSRERILNRCPAVIFA